MPKVIQIIEEGAEIVIQDIEIFAKQVAQRLGLEHEKVSAAMHETAEAARPNPAAQSTVQAGSAADGETIAGAAGETDVGESASAESPSTIPSATQGNTTIAGAAESQSGSTLSGSGTDTGAGGASS